jgi:hypothetical protein
MSSADDEVRKLLLDALDGDATEEQLASLNTMLRESEALRQSAARFLSDDSILAEEIGTLEEALAFLRQSADVSGRSLGSARDERLAVPARHDWREATAEPLAPRSRWGRALHAAADYVNAHGLFVAAAAALCLAAFASDYLNMMKESDRLHELTAATDAEEVLRMRNGRRPVTASLSTTPVARVTGLSNCIWPDGDAGLKFGDALTPGQRLKLTSGVLQLTYETGAKVTVEGPVDMVMTTPIEARLSEGKIAAAVPRFARGYTIVTPTAEVVDLGTEFGVSVDDVGASEVHVFDGDVVTRSIGGKAAASDLIHAREDEAVQFTSIESGPRRISVDRTKFVRRLTPDLPADKLPRIPVTDDLALWLAADLMPTMKEGAPVSAWPDVLIGDNRFPDDAWQFDERLCPAWIRDGEGRPAVRFDGWKSYLATSPMEAGDAQTAFVVFAPNPASFASDSHGGMLLKYGLNAPSLELSLMTDHSPRGLVWAADQVGSTSNVGMIKGKAVQPLAPCAVAYSYNVAGDQAELMVDGVSQGVATAPRKIEQHAKKYIGSHAQPGYEAYYLGNIYEVIVYDAALDDADRARVFQYLSDRYGIKLGR